MTTSNELTKQELRSLIIIGVLLVCSAGVVEALMTLIEKVL